MTLASFDSIERFVRERAPLFVITGAGISTASGIPDYRDGEREWKRPPPVQLQTFLASEAARARYWARSFAGWPRFAAARPNQAHEALVTLEALGHLRTLVTQNVDRLHQRAGHRDVVDLHGRLDRAVCLKCGAKRRRTEIQRWLARENPGLDTRGAAAPDGDVDLDGVDTAQFRFPSCPECGGVLKPDVVFFGENVPRPIVASTLSSLAQSRGVLLLGTSASTFSCFRYCRHAHGHGIPLAIVNRGRTRG